MKCELQLYVFLCLIIAIGAGTPCNICPNNTLLDGNVSESNHSSYRLPKEIVPSKYVLHLNIDQTSFVYTGRVAIFLTVLEPTDRVVVHSDGLRIVEKAVVFARLDTSYPLPPEKITCQFYDTERQFYVMKTEKTFEPGKYLLSIEFEGVIRDDVFGFYRSFYAENGETKWIAVTQFSPTYARRAFPCMDEPHLKAVFRLQFNVSERVVTSNTQILDGISWDDNPFQETPPMSTYLLGWAIHEFVPEPSINSSSNFKMWTRRSMNHRGSAALNRGESIYSFLKDWFSIENPIGKMDQFAIPDFNFHAMENWGMITYRESVVLHEDKLTSTKTMLDGLTTMAHEYAHTWFGNLVTPKFWDVAWLKEGFASYFQYFALSAVQPTWRMMDKFVVDMLQPAMILDSEDHDRVMNGRNVGSPSSIAATLDFVSYKKGIEFYISYETAFLDWTLDYYKDGPFLFVIRASVIRMLSHVIGESAFQNGLRSYVNDMMYQAATPFDLYKHLQKSTDELGTLGSDMSIEAIMESWTTQPGYPLVTITRDKESRTITMAQERFSWNHNLKNLKRSSGWWIPLTFTIESQANFSNTTTNYWLNPHETRTISFDVPSDEWVIFNVQHVGYYRVNYDEDNWFMLRNSIRFNPSKKIHVANRAALIDDAFNLARAGYVNYSIPIGVSTFLMDETDYEPWVPAVNHFRFLNKMFTGVPEMQQAFQEYANTILQNMYERVNFTGAAHEDVTTKLLREIILSTSCLMQNVDCLNTCGTLFRNWIDQPASKPISPDLKSFVYCEGIRDSSESDWYRVMDRWLIADLQTEQDLLLQALGCTQNPKLIETYLELSLSDEQNVRKQQRTMIVDAVLEANPGNADHVLRFVRSNLRRVIELRGHVFLGKVITAIGHAMTTGRQTEQLRMFIELHSKELGPTLDTAKKALSVSLENEKWVERFMRDHPIPFEQIK